MTDTPPDDTGPFNKADFMEAVMEVSSEEIRIGDNIVPLAEFPETWEIALAEGLYKLHGDELRWDYSQSQWAWWDGQRWQPHKMKAYTLTRELCANTVTMINARKGAPNFALSKVATATGITSLVKHLSMTKGIAVPSDIWDADPYLLNTPGGVVDLKTGKMHKADPERYMTKCCSVTPDRKMPTPLFDEFLVWATHGDEAYQNYLWRVLGYCLTGDTKEEIMLFMHGPGGNGKTLLKETIAKIMGDYHRASKMSVFMVQKNEQHPTGIANLIGARFVSAAETVKGRRWNEALIKELTGGDEISARKMRADFFSFRPQFKLLLHGNVKPKLDGVDNAIRRRLHMLPFTAVISEKNKDTDLGKKLDAEAPGILAKMIDGCLEWQRDGLNPPDAVLDATADYLSEQDVFTQWLDECCNMDMTGEETLKALFTSWKSWCEDRQEFVGSWREFRATVLGLDYTVQAPKARIATILGLSLK